MKGESFDFPPCDGEAIHQRIDQRVGIAVRSGCQVGVSGGGEDTVVAEDFLHFEQVDARFDQRGGVTVAQAVGGDLFFIPQS